MDVEGVNLKHRKHWHGTYRHVALEVVQWWMKGYDFHSPDDERPVWNYYLRIPEGQIPKSLRDAFILKPEPKKVCGRSVYPYTRVGIFRDLYWHYGITFYELEGGTNGNPILVVAGCDFNHLWDEGLVHSYDLRCVVNECKRTIDDLCERVPNLRLRCSWNGQWVDRSDGFFVENDCFYSNQGAAERRAKNPEWPELIPVTEQVQP